MTKIYVEKEYEYFERFSDDYISGFIMGLIVMAFLMLIAFVTISSEIREHAGLIIGITGVAIAIIIPILTKLQEGKRVKRFVDVPLKRKGRM